MTDIDPIYILKQIREVAEAERASRTINYIDGYLNRLAPPQLPQRPEEDILATIESIENATVTGVQKEQK